MSSAGGSVGSTIVGVEGEGDLLVLVIEGKLKGNGERAEVFALLDVFSRTRSTSNDRFRAGCSWLGLGGARCAFGEATAEPGDTEAPEVE